MSLSPGTYTIHDTDATLVLTNWTGSLRIGIYRPFGGSNQKWYVKRYPEGFLYAIQNVATNKYVPDNMDGSDMPGVDEIHAAILSLEHQFQDFYLIKLSGTKVHLEHPNTEPTPNDENYAPVSLVNKDTPKGCFWRFERISDDAGGDLKPRTNNSIPALSPPQSNNILSQGSGSQYTDDAVLQARFSCVVRVY
ncbi:unnamed protein product [Rhizoctonia solani]|uniref:Ricin B lectin domain-containing protein n=1 Tax=Rhizoctonia solani TaxID=456999 RepID=A0A8H3GSR7_9AGAM|nr:unnamed protein product [Rhizoctonia solani]